MKPEEYARRTICLYLGAEDTPQKPSPADWEVAKDLCDCGFELEQIEHAIRIVAFRRKQSRANGPVLPIRSLAYFRTVLIGLRGEGLEQGYLDYVQAKVSGN